MLCPVSELYENDDDDGIVPLVDEKLRMLLLLLPSPCTLLHDHVICNFQLLNFQPK